MRSFLKNQIDGKMSKDLRDIKKDKDEEENLVQQTIKKLEAKERSRKIWL